jgi:zinc transport system substrate-binding protein
MLKHLRFILISAILAISHLEGCTQTSIYQSSKPGDKLAVTVSIAPQKYFLERIGGDRVRVNVMVEPGNDPHTYEPKPEQLRQLSQSKAYFSIGINLEQAWMNRLSAANQNLLVVDTSRGIQLLPISESLPRKEKQDKHHKEEENLDPHIWLSPKRVKQQGKTIYDALVKLDPQNKVKYKENLDNFLKDIDALDAEIRQQLKGAKHHKFMVFHPEWGYFAKDYGLEMIPIEIGGTEPSAAELAELITKAKKDDIKIIFAQPEFSKKSAEVIAKEIGGEVILIRALSPDWMNNLRQVSKKFAQVLSLLKFTRFTLSS